MNIFLNETVELGNYNKRFHSCDYVKDKLSTLVRQLMKETINEDAMFLPPHEFLLSEFDCFKLNKKEK